MLKMQDIVLPNFHQYDPTPKIPQQQQYCSWFINPNDIPEFVMPPAASASKHFPISTECEKEMEYIRPEIVPFNTFLDSEGHEKGLDRAFPAMRTKKSDNTTECVPVPSSEHVAEIVGRKGSKIKQLRASLKTYIKTPVKGEEPVFIVTGKKADVFRTKFEILKAAAHFTAVRAKRRIVLQAPMKPGEVTIAMHVAYEVVGLIVGPRGVTIKTIQRKSNAYITTPSRNEDPIFIIRGLPAEVEHAQFLIRQHIQERTGNSAEVAVENFRPNQMDNYETFAKMFACSNQNIVGPYPDSIWAPTANSNSSWTTTTGSSSGSSEAGTVSSDGSEIPNTWSYVTPSPTW